MNRRNFLKGIAAGVGALCMAPGTKVFSKPYLPNNGVASEECTFVPIVQMSQDDVILPLERDMDDGVTYTFNYNCWVCDGEYSCDKNQGD
jgi:hypothetical protein